MVIVFLSFWLVMVKKCWCWLIVLSLILFCWIFVCLVWMVFRLWLDFVSGKCCWLWFFVWFMMNLFWKFFRLVLWVIWLSWCVVKIWLRCWRKFCDWIVCNWLCWLSFWFLVVVVCVVILVYGFVRGLSWFCWKRWFFLLLIISMWFCVMCRVRCCWMSCWRCWKMSLVSVLCVFIVMCWLFVNGLNVCSVCCWGIFSFIWKVLMVMCWLLVGGMWLELGVWCISFDGGWWFVSDLGVVIGFSVCVFGFELLLWVYFCVWNILCCFVKFVLLFVRVFLFCGRLNMLRCVWNRCILVWLLFCCWWLVVVISCLMYCWWRLVVRVCLLRNWKLFCLKVLLILWCIWWRMCWWIFLRGLVFILFVSVKICVMFLFWIFMLVLSNC